MKILTLINTEWKERVTPYLTDEERALLRDISEESREARQVLVTRLRDESLVAVTSEEASTCQALYDQHKQEGATLISVDISLPNGFGIINCRVNGEHKQIRFP